MFNKDTSLDMASVFGLMLLLSSWKCIHSVFDVDQAERPPCNQSLTSLRELLKLTLDEPTELGSTEYVLCVNLPPGRTENIEYSAGEIKYASVIISGNSSVVECETSPSEGELSLSNHTTFPMIFASSSLVVVEGVHFEGCTRPLQFKWITRVEVILSSFR